MGEVIKMLNGRNFRAFPLLALFMGSACAAIVSDNKSTTYIETDPENARCELHGKDFKRVVNTPNSIRLPADAAPITVACKAEGYKTTTQPLDTEIDGWIFGNIIFGGVIGILIDAATDSGEIYPPRIAIVLEPEGFRSTTARDEWFDRRRTMLEERWEQTVSDFRDNCIGGDCAAEVSEAKKNRDKQLARLEEKRLRAKVGALPEKAKAVSANIGVKGDAEPPFPRTTALPAVAATSPSSRIAMPRPGAKKGRTFSARQLTLLFSGSTVTATEYGATCYGKYETERTFKISPDGTFSVSTQCEGYSGQWIILDDDSGTWRVAGDWVCMAFRSRRDDDDECWAVKNTRQGFVALGPGGGVEWHLAISNPRYSSKEALLAALNTAKAGTP